MNVLGQINAFYECAGMLINEFQSSVHFGYLLFQQRTSYEWYIPKGILKKILDKRPAIMGRRIISYIELERIKGKADISRI